MIRLTCMSLLRLPRRTRTLKWTVCFFSLLPATECLLLQTPFVQEVTQWLDKKHIPFQTMDWQDLGMTTTTTTAAVLSNSNHNSQMLTILPEHGRSFLLHILPTTPTTTTRSSSSSCCCSADPGHGVDNNNNNNNTMLPVLQLLPTLTKQLTEQVLLQDNKASGLATTIIHLHQDVWQSKGDIVRSRLLVRCGQGPRIFARKTRVRRIPSNQAIPFLHANHLWSATKAKYYYGLFWNVRPSEKKEDNDENENDDNENENDERLVAVVSISARRNVVRDGIPHRSHELLRFCSIRDTTVVGGISKLLKAFILDHQPDDIVTVVDRDWGSGHGWHTLGFTTVHVMPPLTMMVDNNNNNPTTRGVVRRRHLVGVGIQHPEDVAATNQDRLGLPRHVLEQLDTISEHKAAYECLRQHGFVPVYDAGVERLFKTMDDSAAARQRAERTDSQYATTTTMALWEKSVPSYTTSYYSPNSGIVALLKHAENMDRHHHRRPVAVAAVKDSVEEHASLESWRSTS